MVVFTESSGAVSGKADACPGAGGRGPPELATCRPVPRVPRGFPLRTAVGLASRSAALRVPGCVASHRSEGFGRFSKKEKRFGRLKGSLSADDT